MEAWKIVNLEHLHAFSVPEIMNQLALLLEPARKVGGPIIKTNRTEAKLVRVQHTIELSSKISTGFIKELCHHRGENFEEPMLVQQKRCNTFACYMQLPFPSKEARGGPQAMAPHQALLLVTISDIQV